MCSDMRRFGSSSVQLCVTLSRSELDCLYDSGDDDDDVGFITDAFYHATLNR